MAFTPTPNMWRGKVYPRLENLYRAISGTYGRVDCTVDRDYLYVQSNYSYVRQKYTKVLKFAIMRTSEYNYINDHPEEGE